MSPTDQRLRTVAERRSKLEQQKMEAALKREANIQNIHDRLRRRPKIPIKYYARSVSTPPTASSRNGPVGPSGTQTLVRKGGIQYPAVRTQPIDFDERPDWIDITHKEGVEFELLPWPSRSPDLHIIEKVWIC